MTRNAIATKSAPPAIGPYSQAIASGNLLFVSGQIGLDPEKGKLVDGGIAEQTQQVFRNLTAILTAAGTGFERVVKTTVYLIDIADFRQVNEIYATFFPAPPPARSAIAVRELPLGAEIEIEVIAQIG